jgi:MFS transporter, SP family, general alpha glucoside:H+ symporter
MVTHVEDTQDSSRVEELRDVNEKVDAIPLEDLVHEAREASSEEHRMGLWESLKLYPKATAWSVLLSTAVIMEGYDVVLMGSFYAFPQFQKKYGVLTPKGYQLTAAWQSGLSNGAGVGEIIGLFINGWASERFGYRKTMIAALTSCIGFIFIAFFAKNVQMLQVYEILMGIPWGIFQTLTTTYASEVCPVHLRAYLTTYVNLCWIIGQLIASGVLRGLLNRPDEWSYRIPFAVQWVWPVPLIIGIYFAPESPWWLVRKGRTQDAVKSVTRLTTKGNNDSFDAEKTVAMMVHTHQLELKRAEGSSWLDCFKGVELRRTEIACITWSIQNCCSSFQGYSTYFFEAAGVPTTSAFDLSMGLYAMGFAGNILSWFCMKWFGRRTMYIWGLIIMDLCLLSIGFAGIAPLTNKGAAWAVSILLLLETFFYDVTVGTVCYSLVPELSSNRMRTKTIVLARNLYNVVGIINGVLVPHMINDTAWNWGAKAGLFYGGIVFLCLIWTYFRLPEPKGRTYAEIDMLFEMKVPARKFKTTEVDPFEQSLGIDEFPLDGFAGKGHTVTERALGGMGGMGGGAEVLGAALGNL